MANRGGFSIAELLVVLGIAAFFIGAIFGLLGNAQSSFFNSDASIDVRNSLRQGGERMAMELRNTGYKATVPEFTISNGTGVNGSDVIRFAVPILCSTTSTLLDTNGDPAHWGAPLTWGCDQSSCMDLNNSCSTIEYMYIRYSIAAGNKLMREVLDSGFAVVTGGSAVVAQNITDLQASVANNQLTFILTGQKVSAIRKTITLSYTNKVFLNNFGG